jgi:hypothetical protein
MFGFRKTLGSIFLAVFFLALAYTAMVFYNADKQQKEAMINNDTIQKGKAALTTVANVTEKLGTTPPARNTAFETKMRDVVQNTDWRGLIARLGATSSATEASSSQPTPGFMDKVTTFVKDEWNSSQNPVPIDSAPALAAIPEVKIPAVSDIQAVNQNFLDYEKTATGADIIFRQKSGAEYKLSLPFKFLSNN